MGPRNLDLVVDPRTLRSHRIGARELRLPPPKCFIEKKRKNTQHDMLLTSAPHGPRPSAPANPRHPRRHVRWRHREMRCHHGSPRVCKWGMEDVLPNDRIGGIFGASGINVKYVHTPMRRVRERRYLTALTGAMWCLPSLPSWSGAPPSGW